MEINQLIEQILNGETEKFETIVVRYEKPIFSFLIGMGVGSVNVEDIAQDVFVSAYQHLNSYDQAKSQFSTWLFSIAKNKAINYSRKKQIKSFFGFSNENINSHYSDNLAFDRMQNTKQQKIIINSLQLLPEQFKTCAILYFYNDLTLEQIAEIEKCSLGTVKSRLFRAKEAIKVNLAAEKDLL